MKTAPYPHRRMALIKVPGWCRGKYIYRLKLLVSVVKLVSREEVPT